MWKLTAYGESRLGLPGVPWRELTEAEYSAALALYPVLPERGYFERAKAVFDAGTATPDIIPATGEEAAGESSTSSAFPAPRKRSNP